MVIGIIISFTSCKENKDFIELREKNYDLRSADRVVIHKDTSYLDYHLVFRNNPYQFDTTCLVRLVLNGALVYQGNFNDRIELRIPQSLDNKGIRTTLIIQRGNKWFSGNKKGTSFMLRKANNAVLNQLNIVFFPEQEDPDNFLIFDGWVEYIQ